MDDTDTLGGASLTAFENAASKPMQKILQTLRDRAAEATAAERAFSDSLRAAGRGIRMETISPATAALIVLNYNQFNRNVSLAKVDQMVADLKSGDWRIHHQGVAFTSQGDLADGQHRLVACALSGISLVTAVASDFDMGSIDAIDRSTRRTLTQVLQMRGVPNAQIKVRVGKTVVQLKHRIDFGIKSPNFSEHRFASEIRKIDAVLTDGIKYGEASARNVSEPILDQTDTAIAATLLLLYGWEPQRLSSYFISLQEGVAPYDNAPTIALTKLLQKGRGNKDHLDTTSRIALILKAAVLFAQNKRVVKLAWNEHQEGVPNPTLEVPSEAAE